MSFKAHPLPDDAQERKCIHAAFNDWLCQANDEELLQLEQARERFAPHQVCSTISLVRGCFARGDLANSLPASLRQRLKERNWPPACVGAQAL